jgi:UDP-glucose 4-epimerase
VLRAFLAAADADRAGLWNVGTGREVSVVDLIDGLRAISGAAVEPDFAPPRQGELQASALDPAALERDLEVTPAMRIEDGLRAVYDWVRAGEPVRGTL